MLSDEARNRFIAVINRVPRQDEIMVGPYQICAFGDDGVVTADNIYVLTAGHDHPIMDRRVAHWHADTDIVEFAQWISTPWLMRLCHRLELEFPVEGVQAARHCHYMAYNNTHLAAEIIGGDNMVAGIVDLAVFTNMPNVNGVKSYGLQFHVDVPYCPRPRPGTWHWIES